MDMISNESRKASPRSGRPMTEGRLKEFSLAWANRDLDKLMEFVHPDCEYRASVGDEPGKTYSGFEAVRGGFREMLDYDSVGKAQAETITIFEDRGIVLWGYEVTDGCGESKIVRGCDYMVFRNGKILLTDAYRKCFPD